MTAPSITDADYYEARPEGFDIFSWCPAPTPTVPSTQVHMHIPLDIGRIIVRFKGPDTLDRLISALIRHRVDVWGTPQDHAVWMHKDEVTP